MSLLFHSLVPATTALLAHCCFAATHFLGLNKLQEMRYLLQIQLQLWTILLGTSAFIAINSASDLPLIIFFIYKMLECQDDLTEFCLVYILDHLAILCQKPKQ